MTLDDIGPAAEPRRHRRLLAVGVAAACALALVIGINGIRGRLSATHDDNSPGERVLHGEDAGQPLSFQGGTGIQLSSRGRMRWWAAFGEGMPCSTTGETITVTGVRLDFGGGAKALDHRFLWNHVPPADEREPGSNGPIIAISGRYPHYFSGLAPNYAGAPPTNRVPVSRYFSEELPYKVSLQCDGGADDDAEQLYFVVELKSGPKGVWLRRLLVDYEVGGTQYTLVPTWDIAMCGARQSEPFDETICEDYLKGRY